LLNPYIKYISALLIAIILQKTFIWLISISQFNITPDIPFIIVIYIGIKRGKLEAVISGFFAGLIVDILSGTFIGLCALIYSITGFISGYFNRDEDYYLQKYYFPVIIFLLALIGNLLYFLIYFQSFSILFLEVLLKYVVPNSTYTALISIVYSIYPKKKTGRLVYR
jgi:rod shape-determining protein MreD